MRDKNRLTDLELVIMRVLWGHDRALTIQEISNFLKDEKLSVQSVTQVMSRLVSKKAVIVSEHVLVSNVYARAFTPAITQQQVLDSEINHLQHSIFGKNKLSTLGLVAALLNNDGGEVSPEDMEELQRIIEQKKNK